MNDDCFLDIFDNAKSWEYLEASRNGDKDKQKLLFNSLRAISKPIIYNYYPQAREVGLSSQDLDDLNIYAFLRIYNKYDVNLGTLSNYYKFVFTNLIKDEIRNNMTSTHSLERDALLRDRPDYDYDLAYDSDYTCEPEMTPLSTEIISYILSTDAIGLSRFERNILEEYLGEKSFLEIADTLNSKYHTVFSGFRRAANKIRTHFKQNLPDVYYQLNS